MFLQPVGSGMTVALKYSGGTSPLGPKSERDGRTSEIDAMRSHTMSQTYGSQLSTAHAISELSSDRRRLVLCIDDDISGHDVSELPAFVLTQINKFIPKGLPPTEFLSTLETVAVETLGTEQQSGGYLCVR